MKCNSALPEHWLDAHDDDARDDGDDDLRCANS